MCGICGVAYFDGERADGSVVSRMRESLTHRGPDDCGIYLDGGVGLGHRRLSIIDVAGGRQPMSNEDGTIWITYNGELYNHLSLREELTARGHRYATNSDTETIIHLYEEYGRDCVSRMNGMFSFAIWDANAKEVFLARDQLGIKPLYYLLDERRLVFASELKAILKHPGVERNIDYAALDTFLAYGYTGSPRTIFEGIRKLPPASSLLIRDGEPSVREYWRLKFPERPFGDEAYHAQRIRELLKASVARQLMSEVPLGAFLSGGIDSSAIVAMMSEVTDSVKTFSVGFEDSSFNELPYARLVAETFGTDHHEFVAKMNVIELLPRLLEYYDEPFADSSAVPTYIVSQMARTNVTVCLSGDGGDELFAGYDRYAACKVAEAYAFVPRPVRGGIASLVRLLPESTANKSVVAFGKRFVAASELPPEQRYASWVALFNEEERGRMYSQEAKEHTRELKIRDYLSGFYRQCTASDFVAKTLCVDLKTYLPEDLLAKVDIASMAHALEVRVPFLDHTLVEYAQTIPTSVKFPGLALKHILRKSFEKKLPKKIVGRRKHGFGVPVGAWFKGELAGLAHDSLLGKDAPARTFFNEEYLERLLTQHRTGRRDNGQRIWALVFFNLWYRKYVLDERIRL